MLGLSVHSMPQPDGAVGRRTRLGRLKMLLVWAVCAAPVVLSYFSFYVLRPEGRSNYGSLITPPVAMPGADQLPLRDVEGRVVTPAQLRGQWLLVVVAGGACDALCEQQLYLQRQLREVLGKDKDRLDRVWLVPDGTPVRPALWPAMKQAWVLQTDASALQRWLKPAAGETLSSHIYLVDPRGDWMMRWPTQADPTRMKKDLVRLLKAAESWDESGR